MEGVSSTSDLEVSSGGVKRSRPRRMIQNIDTLITPERLNVQIPKNRASEDTALRVFNDQRATESGRTIREYARG
jgi:hypothetical protein